jgi:hypothetical protein
MKRKEHFFTFTAEQIAKGARGEAEYHKTRADWWETEYRTAVEAAKTAGLRVEMFKVTGGERAQMVIDPSLQSRINECTAKRELHQKLAEQLTIEAASYETQPGAREYTLDHEDIAHFRLAGGAREE